MDRSPRLLPIGRFAQLTGLTVRALRLYDELGLLRPEAVDGGSRYRYYAPGQLERAGLIGRLRRLDMPLEEVERFLRGREADREEALAVHRARLCARAAAAADAVRALDELSKELSMPTEQRTSRVTPMVLKTLRDQPVLRIRTAWTVEECQNGAPGRDIAEVYATLQGQGLALTAPPYCIWHEHREDGLMPAEVGIPVDRPGTAEGRVEPAVLPGGDVATTLYTGPYQEIGAAYRQLWAEMEAAGLTPHGDPRDVYLTSPKATPDPQDYLTEVVWPVKS